MMKDIEGLKVGDAMTRGVICVDVKDTVQEAAEVMRKNDISSVIVIKKGDGVGIITERDIICKIVADSKNPEEMVVADVMTSPLITIKPETDIDDAARIMRDKNIRRLVVADKDKIIGVISEFDIVRLEPAMHTLIREQYTWKLSEAHAAAEGIVSGICESCENYSEKLTNIDGRLLCDDCTP
jgi:CBS domain-containing protein